MEPYSSGEDLKIKIRKPYTITKQRERWTDEEHNRFLEALKLYGRAWQRTEEHIGTKTAVQIRSHAQKFFSKLEKEALGKGVPVGQSLDIDIPPPRPKRKPCNPYPRKISLGAPKSQVGAKDEKNQTPASTLQCKRVLDLDEERLHERASGEEKATDDRENCDNNFVGMFTLAEEAHSAVSSANKSSTPTSVALGKFSAFREFLPPAKEVMSQDEANESYVTFEIAKNNLNKDDVNHMLLGNGTSGNSEFENFNASHEEMVILEKTNYLRSTSHEMQGTQNCPRNVPVHIFDGSLGPCAANSLSDVSLQDSMIHPAGKTQGLHNFFASSAPNEHQNSAPISIYQSCPSLHPLFTPAYCNQDDYRSFIGPSSTFSNLSVSLLQNPPPHSASSFASIPWPCTISETSAESPTENQDFFPVRQMNCTPSMEAAAVATVAAATAWWATQGLLPSCAAFTCASSVPLTDTNPDASAMTGWGEDALKDLPSQEQQLDPEQSDAMQAQNSPSKSPTLSSVSEESEAAKPKDYGSNTSNHQKIMAVSNLCNLNKSNSMKQVDRSSCCSNTQSSTEVETDPVHKNVKEYLKEPETSDPTYESNIDRSRITVNLSDSWKVSEEGRLAFRALFSQGVLPQSFPPPHDLEMDQREKIEETKMECEKDDDESLVDLNKKSLRSYTWQQCLERSNLPCGDSDGRERLGRTGLVHGMFGDRQRGFKPYKRCSVQAKENRVGASNSYSEEKDSKRICLEVATST